MSNISSGDPETIVRSRSGPRLVAQQGAERGRSFAIPAAGLLVGRAAECSLPLDDAEVSRRHARFYWHGSRLMVEDLGSANGTVVNGRPISGAQPLNERDMVGIGHSVFIVQGLVSQELTPTARNLDAAVAAPAPRYAAPPPQAAPSDSTFWWVVIGLGLAALIIILGLGAFWYFSRTTSVSQVPAVTFITPGNGAQVELNVPIIVQATATDSRGIIRIELWADNVVTGQQASANPAGDSPLLLNLTWTPLTPGSHVLEVRAFNAAGQQNSPALVTVNAVAGTVTATSQAPVTDTPTPNAINTPTATAPAIILFTPTSPATATSAPTAAPQPGLQAVADVNVRGGPATTYPILGLLRAGDTAAVAGRSADSGWWQIVFPPNSGNLGWVAGTYVQTNDAANGVPIVAGPAPPPTNTPLPSPPTNTPPPAAEVTFTADSTELTGGQCTRLRWQVKNVAAYFVDGVAGAGDIGEREVCDPVGTTTHTLRIQRQDGSTQDLSVTINVRPSDMPKPDMISPDDDEELNKGDEIDFDWSNVSAPGNITYSIQVEYKENGDWKNWRTANGLTNTSYEVDDFPEDEQGRWRVWASSSALGDSERTGWREFTFDD